MREIKQIQYELQCAKGEFRMYAKIEGELTREERARKDLLQKQIDALEKELPNRWGR